MISLPLFTCDGCGACCRTWPIYVTEADAQLEPRIVSKGLREPSNADSPTWHYRLNPSAEHLACSFLAADQTCSIYATRPQLCRDFGAGSNQCQEARFKQGLALLNANK